MRRLLAGLVAVAVLAAGGCSSGKVACGASGQPVCVATDPDGVHGWPQQPEDIPKPPEPVVTKDRTGRERPAVTAPPPGWPINSAKPDSERREKRVTFVFRRSAAQGPPDPMGGNKPFAVELEWASTDGQSELLTGYTQPGYRHTILVPVGTHVQFWVTPDRGQYRWLKAHIEVNGRIPTNSNRPPAVPQFRPESYAEWPHHAYVNAWVF